MAARLSITLRRHVRRRLQNLVQKTRDAAYRLRLQIVLLYCQGVGCTGRRHASELTGSSFPWSHSMHFFATDHAEVAKARDMHASLGQPGLLGTHEPRNRKKRRGHGTRVGGPDRPDPRSRH